MALAPCRLGHGLRRLAPEPSWRPGWPPLAGLRPACAPVWARRLAPCRASEHEEQPPGPPADSASAASPSSSGPLRAPRLPVVVAAAAVAVAAAALLAVLPARAAAAASAASATPSTRLSYSSVASTQAASAATAQPGSQLRFLPPDDLLPYVQYKVLQALTLPTWGKVLTLLAVAAPILAIGSGALAAVTGERLGAAVVRCYTILNNVPGADIAGESDPRAALVLNAVYCAGLLSFAVLIGVLGDDIASAVEGARLGNGRVPERHHTLVLGHNRQLVEVLRQVAAVRADRGTSCFPGQLVVLSEVPREALEASLAEALGPKAAAGVVARTGSPLKTADLHRVSAGAARTVILLAPDPSRPGGGGGGEDGGEDAAAAAAGHELTLESRQAVTLAALQLLRQAALEGPGGGALGAVRQTVVVQQDEAVELLAAAGYGGGDAGRAQRQVASVSRLNSLHRILAQCAAQPGLSAVLGGLMRQQHGLPEFYVQSVPEVVGLSYGQARRLFPRAVLCGLYDPGAQAAAAAKVGVEAVRFNEQEVAAVRLNPPDSETVAPTHSLILLADSGSDLRVDVQGAQRAAAAAALAAPASAPTQRGSGGDRGTPGGSRAAKAAAGSQAAAAAAPPPQLLQPARASGGTAVPAVPAPLRVVVLSCDGSAPAELLEALADYCPPGSSAVVVGAEGTDAGGGGLLRTRGQQAALHVQHVAADPRTRSALAAADAANADAVILTGLDGAAADAADAQAMATLLQLQAIMPYTTAAHAHHQHHLLHAQPHHVQPLNLVCTVSDPRTRDMLHALARAQAGPPAPAASAPTPAPTAASASASAAPPSPAAPGALRRRVVVDAVHSDELLAGVLAQVAAEPRLAGVFHELASAEGAEVYMRAPGALGVRVGQAVSWEEVQDAGRRHGTTVIGLLRGGSGDCVPEVQLGVRPYGKGDSGGGPAAVLLGPGDGLVVLAEERQ